MSREITQSFLAAAGHEADCAEGGMEATAVAADIDYDAIFMDVRMPQIDGLEATRRIRSLSNPRGRVPIVAMTAYDLNEQIEACRRAGMNKHLTKPFTQDMLLATLAEAIADGTKCGEVNVSPDMQLFDTAIIEHITSFFSKDTVFSYLQTIERNSRSLLCALEEFETDFAAVELAHELVGSAGMLGFHRLSTAARRFEHAVATHAADTSLHSDILRIAIEDSLREIQRIASPDMAH
jgi:CheY-like chemotaxis protein/HPt (histidine-containing phosphotransfer) domain-containing protein